MEPNTPQPAIIPQPELTPAPIEPTPASPPPPSAAGMFQGRLGRLGFLMAGLYLVAAFGILIILAVVIGHTILASIIFLLTALLVLATIPLGVGIHIRRWHDMGQSGWFTLLFLFPAVNLVVLLVMLLLPGTSGPNKYGDKFDGSGDPLHVYGLR